MKNVLELWHLELSIPSQTLNHRKEKVLAKVKEKLTELKLKIKLKQTKPVMSDPDVKKNLEELHQKNFIITIDKVSKNLAFLCRKFFISKLLAEVSSNINKNSRSTYSQTQKSKEEPRRHTNVVSTSIRCRTMLHNVVSTLKRRLVSTGNLLKLTTKTAKN